MKEDNSTENSTEIETLLPTNAILLSNAANTPEVTAIIVTVLVVLSLVSVFGNALVLAAIYMDHNLRTASNILFGNLALSDFLQGGIAITCRVVELLYTDCNYRLFCPFLIALSILFGGSSNLSILFISIERFVGVRWPFLYYTYMTTKGVFVAITLAWVSLAVFASLPLFAWGGRINGQATFCRFPLFLNADYITALYLLVHIIPICIIAPLYILILKASLKSIRRIHSQEQNVRTQTHSANDLEMEETDINAPRVRKRPTTEAARQRKSAKTVSLVVGLFILLIMPIVVIDIVEMVEGPTVPPLVIKIAVIMAYANHSVNVFVYAGCNGDYKRAFAKILSRVKSFFISKIPINIAALTKK